MCFSTERTRRISRRDWFCTTAIALIGVPSAAQEPRRVLRPTDQPADAGLKSLLDRMRTIVASKNASALTALMLPTFRVEFDVGKGPLAFKRHWMPEAPNSQVWDVLRGALDLPGAFYMPSLFCIPYIYKTFPIDLDPLAHVVAVKPGAALRDRPSPDGAVVEKIDYSIMRLAEPVSPPVIIAGNRFLAVEEPGIGRCYAAGSEVYSPAAHRMFFERRAGKWQWISLAAATLADPPIPNQPPARG